MKLAVDSITALIDKVTIVSGVNLHVDTGQVVALVGPNGSGKSTLLRCIYRALKPQAGVISLDGENLWDLSAQESARRTGVVIQEPPSEFDMAVWEVVLMGRTPHKGLLERDTDEDHRMVDDALHRVGMERLAQRHYGTLSGGEKQRVLVARALTQGSKLLVLDEPTNHLDIRFQLEVMELVRGLPLNVLLAMHDLNLAAAYCDFVFVLCEGRVAASGPPEEVLEPGLIRQVFGVDCEVVRHSGTGKVQLIFSPKADEPLKS